MKGIIFSFLFLSSQVLIAQGGSDIFSFTLEVKGDKLSLSNKKQLTKRSGYDNQPHFVGNNAIYYASTNDSGLTDIYYRDLSNSTESQLTNTYLSSEYSPTPTPDGQFISCIRQGSDGSQNLVKYPVKGGGATVLIDNHLVGYHIWLDDNTILCFILNDKSNDLHLFYLNSGRERVLAKNIGRCFKHIPGSQSVSFVQLNKDGSADIKSLDHKSLETNLITKSIEGIQDYAWVDADNMVLVNKSILHQWNRKNGWVKQLNLQEHGLTAVSRIAINNSANKIVMVADE